MNEYLWVEKYRPTNITDYVFRDDKQRNQVSTWVKSGAIPHLLFSGGAGTGKTTLAKVLLNELDVDAGDIMIINASNENNVDTMRTKIQGFASSFPFSGEFKYVLLDEADYLSQNSTQPALRGFIETFYNNCRFIFTCNFKNRIIAPLHSRTSVIEFKLDKSERQNMAGKFLERMKMVLDKEGIEYSTPVLAELLMKHFPDYRRVLNELQRYVLVVLLMRVY